MKNGHKFLVSSIFLIFSGLLTSCSQNPMLNKKYVSAMRANFFLEDASSFPIRECATYFAGKGSESLKTKCDKWSESYYTSLKQNGSINSTITLKEFRAKEFWLAVESL